MPKIIRKIQAKEKAEKNNLITVSAWPRMFGFYDNASATGLGLHLAPGDVVLVVGATRYTDTLAISCQLDRRTLCLAACHTLRSVGDRLGQALLTSAACHIGTRRCFCTYHMSHDPDLT